MQFFMRRIAVCAVIWGCTQPLEAQIAIDPSLTPSLRLLSGGPGLNGVRRAAIEIQLPPGWKTYWRYPGDAGIAPKFDWEGSTNVKSIDVLFPAPVRFGEAQEVSIGYTKSTAFIVNVIPQDDKSPIDLKLSFEGGVCEKLCVPLKAQASVTLPVSSRIAPIISRTLPLIPFKVAFKDQDPAYLAVLSCTIDASLTPPRIDILVSTPKGEQSSDLFIEGLTSDWTLPVPTWLGQNEQGNQRFRLSFEGAPRDAIAGKQPLRLTATSGERSIEVETCTN
jgi:DsbC/DsbD-like thiol-disulfide interchange protein